MKNGSIRHIYTIFAFVLQKVLVTAKNPFAKNQNVYPNDADFENVEKLQKTPQKIYRPRNFANGNSKTILFR